MSFRLGQFSLLWIDQMQRLGFNVDAVDCEWGAGVDLNVLRSRLMADKARGTKLKAVCVVHNETATAVTNNLEKIRQVLGEGPCCVLKCECTRKFESMTKYGVQSRTC